MKTLRIATRNSSLALWQANFIKSSLLKHYPDLNIQLISMLTKADRFLNMPLQKIGGKGLFVKELEQALISKNADIAVHSIKDLPAELPDALILSVVCQREDPRDVLVSNRFENFKTLPLEAIIGTSSLRRQCQLKKIRPDLIMENLRGNVDSRLKKMQEKNYAGIILAAAGLKRLNEENKITYFFSTDEMIPAIGQGAIGIECRKDDEETIKLISVLEDLPTRLSITAERAMNAQFGGNCQIPIAAHATIHQNELFIRGMVGKEDGSEILYAEKKGDAQQAENIGIALAEDLIAQGAYKILNKKDA